MRENLTLCGFAVSNYYNKLKLALLEKGVEFGEELVYPWQAVPFTECSPLNQIPFIKTPDGCLSESQVIFDYIEERYPQRPLYPADVFARAKCRELIQHIELNVEWVARRLHREAFFGDTVPAAAKREAYSELVAGLKATAQLSRFAPYIMGAQFSAADCAAYVHFLLIDLTTTTVFGGGMLEQAVPGFAGYMRLMEQRPHVRTMMADRAASIAATVRPVRQVKTTEGPCRPD